MYFGYPTVNVNQVIANASNIRTGDNPAYTLSDFLAVYPQFGDKTGDVPVVHPDIIQIYIDFANASIKEARWHSAWKLAMGYFVAHWCTLWLRSSVSPDDGKDAIVQYGQTQGIINSESVDGVSYSMDSNLLQELKDYTGWTTTEYGTQLATLSKTIYGKGMQLIW